MNAGSLISSTETDVVVPERAEFVARKQAEFDRLAPRFEVISWLYAVGRLTQLRAATAALARTAGPAQHALDLCCGTGGITRALLQLFPTVTGIDLSPAMLAIARRRCGDADTRVRFLCDEISAVSLPAGSADAAVIGLGLHEMPRAVRESVLEKARFWLRPAAPLVISDYCWPPGRVRRWLFRAFAPALVEPLLLREFLDWPLDETLRSMGFSLLHDQRRFCGALRLSAWAAPASRPRLSRPGLGG